MECNTLSQNILSAANVIAAILILNLPGDCVHWRLFEQRNANSFDVTFGSESYDFVRIPPLHLSPRWGFGIWRVHVSTNLPPLWG